MFGHYLDICFKYYVVENVFFLCFKARKKMSNFAYYLRQKSIKVSNNLKRKIYKYRKNIVKLT